MLAYCIGCLEILCLLVLTGDAQVAHLDLLLKVFQQAFFVLAELDLTDEESVAGLHVTQTFLDVAGYQLAEQTSFRVFSEGRRVPHYLFPDLNNGMRIVTFGVDVLFESVGGSKLFTA